MPMYWFFLVRPPIANRMRRRNSRKRQARSVDEFSAHFLCSTVQPESPLAARFGPPICLVLASFFFFVALREQRASPPPAIGTRLQARSRRCAARARAVSAILVVWFGIAIQSTGRRWYNKAPIMSISRSGSEAMVLLFMRRMTRRSPLRGLVLHEWKQVSESPFPACGDPRRALQRADWALPTCGIPPRCQRRNRRYRSSRPVHPTVGGVHNRPTRACGIPSAARS